MPDACSNRKARVVPFISALEKDRQTNLLNLIEKAKKLKSEGIDLLRWDDVAWKIKSGRLARQSGKNTIASSLIFHLPPKIGHRPLVDDWANLIKALVVLRFHRKQQSISNQRIFIAAVSYVANEVLNHGQRIPELNAEHLDAACRLIASHYSEGAAYNMQKAVREFTSHCDANGLCKAHLDYKFSGMKRPDNASGVGYKRLDDPDAVNTKSEKLISPDVFRIFGELYQNVPKNHKYRFYILVLTLLACLGRRFSEIALLPNQEVTYDEDGNDLKKLALSPTLLSTTGWLRKNGYTIADPYKITTQNRKPNHPFHYTTKKGVIQYCQSHFFPDLIKPIHIDQNGKEYYLQDLLLVRHKGLSSGVYACWIATQCTHSMMTTFLRYFDDLISKYASSSINFNFTSHHFRHTLNTLLDEGGLSDLLQTEWFGRTNPRDTKAYQHTSREKRALMLRKDIKKGRVGGQIVDKLKSIPITVQNAFLKARINAVHDVGAGICVHNFVQTPCERHLQCSADCGDYVWVKDDKGRIDDLKRQYSMTVIARETAEKQSNENNPKRSIDWLAHNDKKLNTLTKQLADNNITEFDPYQYLEEITNE